MFSDVRVPDVPVAVDQEERGAGDGSSFRFVDVEYPVRIDRRMRRIAKDGVG